MAAAAGAAIRIQTLGRFQVVAAGREIGEARRQPVRSALLVYLAIERESTRDRLLGIFWPDRPDARGRHALSQTLHKLRRDLQVPWVSAEGEALCVAGGVEIDTREMQTAASRARHADALSLYQGPFLDGWRLHDTHEFELWAEHQRSRMEGLFASSSRAYVAEREAQGDVERALAACRRWAALAPRDDEAHVRLIELLARCGLRVEARRRQDDLRALRDAEGLPLEPGTAARIDAALGSVMPRFVPAPAPAGECVLVLPFDNLTGREDLEPLGRMAADWISEGLDRTGMVRIVAGLDVSRAASSATATGGTEASPGRLALARESQAGILACGSYYLVSCELELRARIIDVRSGELRGTVDPVRVPVHEAARGVGLVRDRILGLLAAVLEADWTGLPNAAELGVRPPTYESYRAYARGVEHFLKEEFALAIPFFEQAATLDPGFTRAVLMAAAARGNLGQWAEVETLLGVLEAASERLSPYELAALRWHRARLAGDREAAYATHTIAYGRYPGTMAHFVAGLSALEVNRPGVTIAIFSTLDPERGWARQFHRYWEVLTAAHHMAGGHERELEMARRSTALFPGLLSVAAHEARALAALGELTVLERTLDTARDLPPQRAWSHGRLLLVTAEELLAHEYPDAAARWAARAAEALRREATGGPLGARGRSELAQALYTAGALDEAAALFQELAGEFPENMEYRGRLGVLAARDGREEEAARVESALGDLEDRFLFGRNTLWRARIAARLGRRQESVDLLRRAFAEGLAFGLDIHTDVDLGPLRDQAAFRELLRPKA